MKMTYDIIETSSIKNLISKVNFLIESGWVPIGGMVVVHKDNTLDSFSDGELIELTPVNEYSQTMLLEENEEGIKL